MSEREPVGVAAIAGDQSGKAVQVFERLRRDGAVERCNVLLDVSDRTGTGNRQHSDTSAPTGLTQPHEGELCGGHPLTFRKTGELVRDREVRRAVLRGEPRHAAAPIAFPGRRRTSGKESPA